MKRIFLLCTVFFIAATLNAQSPKVSPTYWVVETNIQQKTYSIVRLYDADNRLVHEVRMEGIYFDVTRSRHRKLLNELLKGQFAPLYASVKQKRSPRKRA